MLKTMYTPPPFVFNDPATTEIYTLTLHDALPICTGAPDNPSGVVHYHSSRQGAEETLQKIQDAAGSGMLLYGALLDDSHHITVVDQFVSKNGRLHVLVNNAGARRKRSNRY